MKKETREEGVVDAKTTETEGAEAAATTAVAVPEGGLPAVAAEGISLRFPFVRVGQALSQWRCEGKPPALGEFYIGKDKSSNIRVAGYGRAEGFNAILLDVVPGIMEDKPFTGTANPPKRWVGPDCVEAAAKEGFTLEAKPTGEVWPDTGNPKMRANACRFCYLKMLVPVPEDFDAVDYQLFPIGDRLYTPARVEYAKGAFKALNEVIGNIQRVDEFHHRADKEYRFTWLGRLVRIYSEEAVSKQTGATYPTLRFALAMEGGKPLEMDKAAAEDFKAFLDAMTSSAVPADAADDAGDEF